MKSCLSCGKDNKQDSIYCRACGQSFPVRDTGGLRAVGTASNNSGSTNGLVDDFLGWIGEGVEYALRVAQGGHDQYPCKIADSQLGRKNRDGFYRKPIDSPKINTRLCTVVGHGRTAPKKNTGFQRIVLVLGVVVAVFALVVTAVSAFASIF